MQNLNYFMIKQFQTQSRHRYILQKRDPYWLLVIAALKNLSANFTKCIYQKRFFPIHLKTLLH